MLVHLPCDMGFYWFKKNGNIYFSCNYFFVILLSQNLFCQFESCFLVFTAQFHLFTLLLNLQWVSVTFTSFSGAVLFHLPVCNLETLEQAWISFQRWMVFVFSSFKSPVWYFRGEIAPSITMRTPPLLSSSSGSEFLSVWNVLKWHYVPETSLTYLQSEET